LPRITGHAPAEGHFPLVLAIDDLKSATANAIFPLFRP